MNIDDLEKDRLLDDVAVRFLLGRLVRLLGQKDGLDVGQDSTLGDGDTGKQLVQLLVVPDGQLEMTGDDPGLLVVTGSVASQLEDLSSFCLSLSSSSSSFSWPFPPNLSSLLPSLHSVTNKQTF